MAIPSIVTINATDKLSDSRTTINTNLSNIAAFLDQVVKTTSSVTFAGLALGAGSITMTGSIGETASRITKGWFDDLECTNSIAGDISGNAGTVTNGVYTSSNANVLNDITSTGANIEDAVTKKHASGSDTTLGTIAGNIAFDTTARTIAGIANGNLLDKSDNEIITGDWGVQGVGGPKAFNAIVYSVTPGNEGGFAFKRSHQDTVGYTTTLNDEDIGQVEFYGVNSDADEFILGAYMLVEQDGTSGADHIPMRFVFKTGTDAAWPSERMKIDSAGDITIAGLSGNAGYFVKVDANGKLYTEAS